MRFQSLLGQVADQRLGAADLKWTAGASVATVTEGTLAWNARWGRIGSPWWAFAPEQTMYAQDPQPVAPALAATKSPELFLMLGGRLKLRAYNAFLEGQFRHSDLRYSSSDLNQVLGEAWAGVEFRTASGLELRYLARWQSPELRCGFGSRSIVWGSIEVSKTLDGAKPN